MHGRQIEDGFNYYFNTIGEKLESKIAKTNSSQMGNKQVRQNTMSMYPPNKNEIKKRNKLFEK